MSIINYYVGLFSKGTVGAYISLGVVGLVLLFVIVQSVLAYDRGTSRSMVRFISVVVAAVFAIFGTRFLGRAFFANMTFGQILPLKVEALAPLMDATLSATLLPFVYTSLFFLCATVLLIPHKLLCGILGFSHKRNNKVTRLFAIVVAIMHACLTVWILLFPIFGIMGGYADAAAKADPPAGATAFYDKYVKDTVESPIYEYSMKYVGDPLIREFGKSTK